LYNLFVNNERYGSTTLTPLFEDYMKESDSVGNNYIKFSSKVDSGEINLYDVRVQLQNSSEYQDAIERNDLELKNNLEKKAELELINDLLFYGFNANGKLSIQGQMELKVKNGDFVVVTGLTESATEKKALNEEYNIIKLIKEGGFIINFECA
jgi:hypothetical protein